jgi:AraC family ethanolamine operon transcriptional activator
VNDYAALSASAAETQIDPVEVGVIALTDIDEYGASITGWVNESHQLSSGAFTGVSSVATFAGMQLFEEVTSQRMHVKFSQKPNTLSITLPLSMNESALFSGIQVNPSDIVCYGGNEEFTYYTAQHNDSLTLAFDVDDFARYTDQVDFSAVSQKLNKPAFLRVAHGHDSALQAFLRASLTALLRNPSALQHKHVQDSLRESIYANVLNVIGRGDNLSAFALPKQRYALVARAREYLFHDPDCETFTISNLCRFLGVGSRTLEYAFQDVLGMTAIAYLRALRLNYVRQEIKAGGPNTSVIDIAARWGFWHPSHFSADYKRLFGYLPSETRRRLAR